MFSFQMVLLFLFFEQQASTWPLWNLIYTEAEKKFAFNKRTHF
jgi:hypothetical protein